MSEKNNKIVGGAAVLFLSAIVVKLIGAFFKIPLSSEACLGDLGFGYFCTAYDFFTPFYSIAMAGLPVAVAKITAEKIANGDESSADAVLRLSRRVYAGLGIVILAVSVVLVLMLLYLQDSTGALFYGIIFILPSTFFCCLMSSYRGYYEGLCDMKPTAISELIEALCKLCFGLGLGFVMIKITGNPALGAAGATFGITLATAFATFYLAFFYRASKKSMSSSDKTNSGSAWSLLLFAMPVALASLSSNIALIGDAATVRPIISGYTETSNSLIYSAYSSVKVIENELATFLYGIRGKAYTLYNLVPTFTAAIGISAVPVISLLYSKKDIEELKNSVSDVIRLTAFITFPAGIGFITVGDGIMSLLYDSKASAEIGGPILRIFGIAVLFAGFIIPSTTILQAIGKQKTVLLNIAFGLVIKLLANIYFMSIPKINILGSAIGTLICYAVIFIMNFTVIVRELKCFKTIAFSFVKPLSAAIVCGAFAVLCTMLGGSDIITLASVLIAGVVYFAVLILLNFFKDEDFRAFDKNGKVLKLCRKYKIIRPKRF